MAIKRRIVRFAANARWGEHLPPCGALAIVATLFDHHQGAVHLWPQRCTQARRRFLVDSALACAGWCECPAKAP
jgi:hypothetical protein